MDTPFWIAIVLALTVIVGLYGIDYHYDQKREKFAMYCIEEYGGIPTTAGSQTFCVRLIQGGSILIDSYKWGE